MEGLIIMGCLKVLKRYAILKQIFNKFFLNQPILCKWCIYFSICFADKNII